MKNKVALLTALGFALAGSAGLAQMPDASRQVEIMQQRRSLDQAEQPIAGTNVPSLYEGESSDVGPQSVVELKPRRTWIQAFADQEYFYTDNLLQTDHGGKGADVLVSTAQAALAPTPFAFQGGRLAPQVGYQQQWFNFDLAGSGAANVYNYNTGTFNNVPLDSFDFNVSTVFGDVAWQRQNWTFSIGGDFLRMLSADNYNEFYREYGPRGFIRRDFPITPATSISVAYEGDFLFSRTASPLPPGLTAGYNDRTDHSLVVYGSWRLCPHAILQPVYRLEFTHYTDINRDDLLNSFGLTLYCPLTRSVALRGFVGYDNLATDAQFAQHYEQLSAGVGVNFTVNF